MRFSFYANVGRKFTTQRLRDFLLFSFSVFFFLCVSVCACVCVFVSSIRKSHAVPLINWDSSSRDLNLDLFYPKDCIFVLLDFAGRRFHTFNKCAMFLILNRGQNLDRSSRSVCFTCVVGNYFLWWCERDFSTNRKLQRGNKQSMF